jgi:hypothetical protein
MNRWLAPVWFVLAVTVVSPQAPAFQQARNGQSSQQQAAQRAAQQQAAQRATQQATQRATRQTSQLAGQQQQRRAQQATQQRQSVSRTASSAAYGSVGAARQSASKATPIIGRDQRNWVRPEASRMARDGRPTITYKGLGRVERKSMNEAVERFRQKRMEVELRTAARAGLTGQAAMASARANVERQAARYKNAVYVAHNRSWIQGVTSGAKVGANKGVVDIGHMPRTSARSFRELIVIAREKKAIAEGRLSSSQNLQMERRVEQWSDRNDARATKPTWTPKPSDGSGSRR